MKNKTKKKLIIIIITEVVYLNYLRQWRLVTLSNDEAVS